MVSNERSSEIEKIETRIKQNWIPSQSSLYFALKARLFYEWFRTSSKYKLN